MNTPTIVLALMLAPVVMGQYPTCRGNCIVCNGHFYPSIRTALCPGLELFFQDGFSVDNYNNFRPASWTTPEPVLDQYWEPLHPLVKVEERVPPSPVVANQLWIENTEQRIASQIVRRKWPCVDVLTHYTYVVICERGRP